MANKCPICKRTGTIKACGTMRRWYDCSACRVAFSEKLITSGKVVAGVKRGMASLPLVSIGHGPAGSPMNKNYWGKL